MKQELQNIGAGFSAAPESALGPKLSGLLGLDNLTIRTVLVISLVVWAIYMVVTLTIAFRSEKGGW